MCPDVMSGHLLSAVSTTTETMRSLPICSYSLALFLLLPCFFPTYQPIPSFLLSAHVNLFSLHQLWQTRVAIRATLALKTAQQPPLQLLDDHFLLNHHPGRLFLPTHIPAIKIQHHPPQLL